MADIYDLAPAPMLKTDAEAMERARLIAHFEPIVHAALSIHRGGVGILVALVVAIEGLARTGAEMRRTLAGRLVREPVTFTLTAPEMDKVLRAKVADVERERNALADQVRALKAERDALAERVGQLQGEALLEILMARSEGQALGMEGAAESLERATQIDPGPLDDFMRRLATSLRKAAGNFRREIAAHKGGGDV